MTTPFHTKPTHRPAERPSRLTELPDPPQSPDMATQFPDISRAHMILDEHYAALGNVVAMGASYLCWETSETQRGAPYPDLIVALDASQNPGRRRRHRPARRRPGTHKGT